MSQKLRLWDKRARVLAPTILWNDFHWLSFVCGRSLHEQKRKDGVEWDIGSESTLQCFKFFPVQNVKMYVKHSNVSEEAKKNPIISVNPCCF